VNKSISLALAVAALVLPAPVKAELTGKDARDALYDFTRCVSGKDPKEAESVVLSTIPNGEIVHKYPRLVDPNCLRPGQLVMPGDYLRYGLAEWIIRREYANGLPSDIALAAPLPHYEIPDYLFNLGILGRALMPAQVALIEQRRNQAIGFQTLAELGECVDRKDPPGALRLVLSKIHSAAETQAFAALHGSLSSCLSEGETISFDPAALRGTIALNLFRLAKASRIASRPAN